MKAFHIDIVTPDGIKFSGEVESLLVRTDDGDVEILAGHTDPLASLGTGRVRIIEKGTPRFGSVNGGFLTVKGKEVSLCAITFEFADEIDLDRAEIAKAKAEDAIKEAKSDAEIDLSKAKLLRALSRINVAKMK